MRDLAKEMALRKQKHDLYAEVVRMYKSGFGIRRIALKTGVSKTQTRKWLIDAGVYSPPTKSTKPAGEGDQSQYAILRNAAKRRADEGHKRKVIAACLRGLRKGIPVERTCHERGWNEKSVWNFLRKNRWYPVLRAKLRAARRWGDEMAKGRRLGFISKTYRTEVDLQDAIERILLRAGIEFAREARLTGCRTRVDFLIGKDLYLECKMSCKAGQFYEALGQLFHYSKLSKQRPVLLLPDDVTLRVDLANLVPAIPALILRESQLLGFLKGQPTLPLASVPLKPSNRFKPFKCKCCGQEGKQRSRGQSGQLRSYCVDCEPLIPEMMYDLKLDRWVCRRQLSWPASLIEIHSPAGSNNTSA